MSHIKQSDYSKIKRFFNRNTRRNQTEETPIVKKISDTDIYIGMYHIIKFNEMWIVEYNGSTVSLSTRKNALYYAVLSFHGKHQELIELRQLDYKASLHKDNIARYHDMMKQTTNSWKYELFCNKLSEEEARYSAVRADLRKWVNLTKYKKLGI